MPWSTKQIKAIHNTQQNNSSMCSKTTCIRPFTTEERCCRCQEFCKSEKRCDSRRLSCINYGNNRIQKHEVDTRWINYLQHNEVRIITSTQTKRPPNQRVQITVTPTGRIESDWITSSRHEVEGRMHIPSKTTNFHNFCKLHQPRNTTNMHQTLGTFNEFHYPLQKDFMDIHQWTGLSTTIWTCLIQSLIITRDALITMIFLNYLARQVLLSIRDYI